MAVQASFYQTDGVTTRYPQTKHIASKQHVGVFAKDIATNVWIAINVNDYEIINNTVTLVTPINPTIYFSIEVIVADNQNELADSLTDISIVISISQEIIDIAAIKDEVVEVAAVAPEVFIVAGDIKKGKGTNQPTDSAILNALDNANDARSSKNLAYKWAENPEDVIVENGEYSEHHWAIKAKGNSIQTMGVIYVDIIDNLYLFDGTIDPTVIVREEGRGGTFNYDSTMAGENDGGTVFNGWVREYSGAVNVKWFGAKEGVDSTVAIQKALDNYDNIISDGGINYTITNALVKNSSCIIDFNGSTLDFSTTAIDIDIDYFSVLGTEESTIALSMDLVAGTKSIFLLNTTGLSAGDTIRIASDDIYDASSTNQKFGELGVIDTIVGNTVTLASGVNATYSTASNARVSKINMVTANISNLNIIGAGHQGANRTQHGLVLSRTINSVVKNVHVKEVDRACIQILDSMFFHVKDCSSESAFHTTTGYGISVVDACQDGVVDNFRTRNTRHSTSTNNTSAINGLPRRITFRKCLAENTINSGDAFDTHTAAEDISFIDCEVLSSSNLGINIECSSGTIRGARIKDCEKGGIRCHNEADYEGTLIIEDVEIRNVRGQGLRISGAIRGAGTSFTDVYCNNINIYNSESVGFICDYLLSTTPMKNFSLSNINVKRSSASLEGIYLSNIENLTLNGFKVKTISSGGRALRLVDCSSATVTSGLINIEGSANTGGILVDGASKGVFINDVNIVSDNPSVITSYFLNIDTDVTNINIGNEVVSNWSTSIVRGDNLDDNSYINNYIQSYTITGNSIPCLSPTMRLYAGGAVSVDTIRSDYKGRILTLTIASAANPVTIVTQTGNIRMNTDFILNDTRDSLTLLCIGGYWVEISRASYN